MAIDPETQAAMAANNAEVQAQWDALWEQQQVQFDEQKAQAEAGIYQSMAFNKFGQAAENQLFHLQIWGGAINERAEILASGSGEVSSPDLSLFADDTSGHWDVIANGFGNTKKKEEEG